MTIQQMFLGLSGGGGYVLPAYLTNTDDLVYYIDMHTSESYPGSGTAITDLSGVSENYGTSIRGTLNTDWYYESSEAASSNPAWGRTTDEIHGYIRTTNYNSANLKFGTSDFTIEMWVRPHSVYSTYTIFQNNYEVSNNYPVGYPTIPMGARQSDSPGDSYCYISVVGRYIYSNKGKVRVGITYPGYNAVLLTSTPTWSGYNSQSDVWGSWNHIVLTRSEKDFKLYVNSTLAASGSSSITVNFAGNNYCASFMDAFRSTFDGYYGKFGAARIYKGTALSSSDISAHYYGEKAAYGLS